MENIKCVIVGTDCVGKTCSLISYCSNTFRLEYVQTVFDNYSANVMVDGKSISLALWDTAGREEYDGMRPLSYPQTNIFLVMFDVSNRASYESALSKFVDEINQHCPKVPKLLVGNKIDLDKREVSKEEAESSSLKHGFNGYFEISAKTQQGLKNLFDEACRTALAKKPVESSIESDTENHEEKIEAEDEEDEWTKKAKEDEDPFPEEYKFGIYLIDKYEKNVEDKIILKTEVASLWKLTVALVKKLITRSGKKNEDDLDDKALVKEYFDDTDWKIYIEDPDFNDFFLLDSYELLKQVGEKTNRIVKLQLVGNCW